MSTAKQQIEISARAIGSFWRERYCAVVYFNGPNTKWRRSQHDYSEAATELFPGVRMIDETNTRWNDIEPHLDEILASKRFRTRHAACVWAAMKVRGLANCFADIVEV